MDNVTLERPANAADEAWLDNFCEALASRDAAQVAALFANDCHWRDILAFTWNLHTTSGAAAIAKRLTSTLAYMARRGFSLSPGRTPPRHVERAGVEVIEAI